MGPREIDLRVERERIAADIGRLDDRTRGPADGAAVGRLDAIRTRADAVLGLWGERATDPVPWERIEEYRRRCLAAVQKHSPAWKDKDFSRTYFDALDVAEDVVFADARAAAFDPATVPPGQLRAVRERDEAGRLVTRWVGDNGAWMSIFAAPGRRGRINERAE